MTSDDERQRLVSAEAWLEQIRSASGSRPGGDPSAVHAIKARLEKESDQAVRRQLNLALASEYKVLGKHDVSERIYLKLFNESPDEPMPLILLAGQKLYGEGDPAAAMHVIDQALVAAFRSGNFRRLGLGVKARIALKQGKFSVVEDVIRLLLQLQNDPRGVDVGIERDFFDRLPPGAIDETLALKFAEHARAAGPS